MLIGFYVAAGGKPQAAVHMINEKDFSVRVIEQHDIGHQMPWWCRRLCSSKDIVGLFEPLERRSDVLILHLVERRDAGHKFADNGRPIDARMQCAPSVFDTPTSATAEGGVFFAWRVMTNEVLIDSAPALCR
jgi:hypothetical protein